MSMRKKIITILLISIVSLISGIFNNKAFAASGWSDAPEIVNGGPDAVGSYISFGQYDLQHNGGNLGDVQFYCAQHDRTLTNSRTTFKVNTYIEINGRTGEIRGVSNGGSLNEWHSNGDTDIKENKIFATILGGNSDFSKGYGYYRNNTKTQTAVWKFFNQSSWVSQNMGSWFRYTHAYSGGNEAYNAAKNAVENDNGYKGIVKISFLTNANSASYFQTLMIVATEDQNEPPGITIKKIDKDSKEIIKGAKFILSKKNPDNEQVSYLKGIEKQDNGEYKYEWDDLEQFATRLDVKDGEMTLPNFIDYEKNNGCEKYEYSLKEIETPPGYENPINQDKITTFKLSDIKDNEIVLEIENTIGVSGLTIIKVDEKTGEIIKGAKFIIYKKNPSDNRIEYLRGINKKDDGSYEYEWTTDVRHFATKLDLKDGEVTLPNFIEHEINLGSENFEYYVEETDPPEGYKNHKNQNKITTFKLSEAKDNTIVLKIENSFGNNGLTLIKVDEKTGEILKGAKFIIYKKNPSNNRIEYLRGINKNNDGAYEYEWTTDVKHYATKLDLKDGQITLPDFIDYEMENGCEKYEYYVEETDPPEGYRNNKNQNKVTSFKLTDVKGEAIILRIENVKYEGELSIDKIDADTGEALANVGFRIKYLGEKDEEKEDEDNNNPSEDDDSLRLTGKYIKAVDDYRVTEWTDNSDDAYIFTTGSGDNYESILIKGLPIGMYSVIEASNGNAGYESNIGRDWQVEVNAYATTSITAENKKGGNVKISGKVWAEGSNFKDGSINDQYDSADTLLEGIKVIWKTTINGETKIIAQTLTDKNGYYELKSNIRIDNHIYKINPMDYAIINHSYIEFEYNGLKYTTVAATKEGTNTSKATENADYRNTLDSKFTQVTNNRAGEIQLNYENTADHHSILRDLNNKRDETETTIDYNSDGGYAFAVRADTSKTGINRLLDNYAKTEKDSYCYLETSCSRHGTHCHYRNEIDSWSIENMNLGLLKREQPDIALAADIEKVRVIMQDQEYTYRYDNLGIDDKDALFDYKTKFEDMESNIYSRGVNPANIAKYALDVEADESKKDELQVYVTYKIRAKNQSESLGITVKNIVNYYDPQFEIYRGPDSETSEGWTEKGETNNGYNVAYCDFLNSNNAQGRTIPSQKSSETVKIEYRVKPEAVLGLMKTENTVLRNVFEVYTYSSWYAKAGANDYYTMSSEHKTCNEDGRLGNQYAGVDIDSKSASATPGNVASYEDDTHEAPRFKLERAANYKIISGTVFEDTQTDESKSKYERLGNGKNESERGVKNVKVELLKVDEEKYTTTTADLYRIGEMINESGTNGETQLAITYTDENGDFSFGSLSERGVPAGYYIIRYTYGDRVPYITPNTDPNSEALVLLESTIINKDEYDKVNKDDPEAMKQYEEKYKINARNYKSTIVSDGIISELMDRNNLEEEELKWHLRNIDTDRIDNMSTAVDDISELKWIVTDNSIDVGTHEDARMRIGSLKNNNFDAPENVSAFTLPFKVQVEYTEQQEADVDYEGEKEGKFEDDIERFDFGIMERAREDIHLDKTIFNMKVILNNNQSLTEGNPFENKMDFVKSVGRDRKNMEIGNQNTFRNRFFLKNVKDDKQVYIDMDSEYMKSATLDILYDITVVNNSEIDYEYDPEMVEKNYPGYDYRLYYYFGKTPSDAENYIIKPTAEVVIDYLDYELSCQAGPGSDNPLWKEIPDVDYLKGTGHIEGEEDDEFTSLGAVKKGKYHAFITNAFMNVESGDRTSLKLHVSKNLSNDAGDQKFENHAEIIQLNGKIARNIDSTKNGEQIEKTYKPGNYVPSNNMRTTDSAAFKNNPEMTRLHEQDDDSVVVTITPPTGLTNKSVIYISVGAIGLIILAAGVIYIKRRVIK